MGMFDFVRDAGAKVGIGKSTSKINAEKKAKAEAAAKVQADADKAAAAAKAKAAQDAAAQAAFQVALKHAQEAKAAADAAAADLAADAEKSGELEDFVAKLGLSVENLDIRFDDGCAYVSGQCASQSDKEKLVLAIGNVGEVDKVVEMVGIVSQEEEPVAEFYTVVKGDTLSGIAKKVYGDANKYMKVFEANKPMLKDPDEIFPGQSLRIPALD